MRHQKFCAARFKRFDVVITYSCGERVTYKHITPSQLTKLMADGSVMAVEATNHFSPEAMQARAERYAAIEAHIKQRNAAVEWQFIN